MGEHGRQKAMALGGWDGTTETARRLGLLGRNKRPFLVWHWLNMNRADSLPEWARTLGKKPGGRKENLAGGYVFDHMFWF